MTPVTVQILNFERRSEFVENGQEYFKNLTAFAARLF